MRTIKSSQQSSGPDYKGGTSMSRNSRRKVEKRQTAKKVKIDHGTNKEDEISVRTSATASSDNDDDDDFRDNFKGPKSKRSQRKTFWKNIPMKHCHYVKLTRTVIGKVV